MHGTVSVIGRSASGEIIEVNESEAVRRDFMIDSALREWMERKVSVDLPVVDLREEYREIHNRDGEKPDIVKQNEEGNGDIVDDIHQPAANIDGQQIRQSRSGCDDRDPASPASLARSHPGLGWKGKEEGKTKEERAEENQAEMQVV